MRKSRRRARLRGLPPAGMRLAVLLVKHAHALRRELLSHSLRASYRQMVLISPIPFGLPAPGCITAQQHLAPDQSRWPAILRSLPARGVAPFGLVSRIRWVSATFRLIIFCSTGSRMVNQTAGDVGRKGGDGMNR